MLEKEFYTKEEVETAIKLTAQSTAQIITSKTALEGINKLSEDLAHTVMVHVVTAVEVREALNDKEIASFFNLPSASLN